MTLTKTDTGLSEYSGSTALLAELALSYKEGPEMSVVFSEPIELGGDAIPPAGSISFSTGVGPVTGDGMLTGSSSIFGIADMSDFIGPGLVDSLYIDLLIEDSADFALDNASATASLGFDVFDSDSGLDDAVIGVTYTFTPTSGPEPTSFAMLSLGCGWFLRRRQRKRHANRDIAFLPT
ncbi:MAG: PEP-CTERM sorting domain-containing protein [Planctomycetota bacterium]